MTIKLIQLITHQPVLNLLAIRAIKPDEVLFVGTCEEHATITHLQHTLKRDIRVHTMDVHNPFDPTAIYHEISDHITEMG